MFGLFGRRKHGRESSQATGNFALAVAAMGVTAMGSEPSPLGPFDPSFDARPAIDPRRRCIAPWCNRMTTHRGGYCCAEHCKEHRALLRSKA